MLSRPKVCYILNRLKIHTSITFLKGKRDLVHFSPNSLPSPSFYHIEFSELSLYSIFTFDSKFLYLYKLLNVKDLLGLKQAFLHVYMLPFKFNMSISKQTFFSSIAENEIWNRTKKKKNGQRLIYLKALQLG